MRVLVLDGVSPEGLSIFDREPGITVDIMGTMPEEELIKLIGDYDALIVRRATKITAGLLAAAGKLQIIGQAGIGVDNIDLDEATKRGILVANAPDGNTIATTEHTLAMMLALARNIPGANAKLKSGVWNKKMFLGHELCKKTLGIIGLGRIGSAVAKRAKAMEMNVVAYDPYITGNRAAAMGVEIIPFDILLQKSDFITIHTPKTEKTRNILNAKAFAKMKDGVMIINCSRGGLVDEEALFEALKSGKVGGAALDVFEKEPVTNSPLFELDNVIVTPHLGSSTIEAQINVITEVALEIVNALKGRPVKNSVNIPTVDLELLSLLKPYINLGEKLGRFLSQTVTGRVEKLEIKYSGKDLTEIRPVTTAIIKGLLDPMLQEKVNFVNALMLAGERGIQVKETVVNSDNGYANLISIEADSDKCQKTVAGTIFNNQPRIAMIDGYRVSAVPAGFILVIENVDKPGMIGILGTILGRHNISIAGMQNSRKVAGGKAVTVISVDSEVPPDVLDEISEKNDILDVKMISF